MRIARLLSVVLAVLAAGLLRGPGRRSHEPPFRVPDYVTDKAGVLSAPGSAFKSRTRSTSCTTTNAIRLWVVYVDRLSGRARSTGREPR